MFGENIECKNKEKETDCVVKTNLDTSKQSKMKA